MRREKEREKEKGMGRGRAAAHTRGEEGALLLFALALSAPLATSAAGDQAANDGNDTTARRLDRRTKMFLNTARGVGGGDGGAAVGIEPESALGLFDAFFASLSMILVSEIGDETFIIAALMAMRHPKSTVLSGALLALVVMTVLSTGLGRIVPNLISRKHANSAATGHWKDQFVKRNGTMSNIIKDPDGSV